MNTQMLTTSREDIEVAAKILSEGGLVAIPTETVYGLAANALDPEAVSSIFVAKGRPSDNPLIVHISSIEDIERYELTRDFPESARLLAQHFWPGPLTMILPKSEKVSPVVTGGLDSVALRLPSHETARAIIKAADCPLAAPSANLSGSPSPTTAQHVLDDMQGRIPAIVDGGSSDVGLESTVITLCTQVPTVLRPGKVTVEELGEVLGQVDLSSAVLEKLEEGAEAASPGMKYRHYAPKAKVYLVKAQDKAFCDFVNSKDNDSTLALCYNSDTEYLQTRTISLGEKEDYEAQAHNLFSALRAADETDGISTVYVRCPQTDGMGMALFNRLIRAAGFQVITLSEEGYRLIGLTGPTGAGKSQVGKIFSENGFAVVDADEIAHRALTDKECVEKLRETFGEEILEADGSINRARLAKCAFSSRESTDRLNAITHPVIVKLSKSEFSRLCGEGYHTIIFDAPTLFESGMDRLCDAVVAVVAPKDVRLERIMARDSITAEQAASRMNAQKSEEYYAERSAFVIENAGTQQELEQITMKIIKELL